MRLKRLTLTSLMGIAALNIATGSPAVALWAGSQVQGSGPPTMSGVFVVVIVFAILAFALVAVMTRISQTHDALARRWTSAPAGRRRPRPASRFTRLSHSRATAPARPG